MKHAALFRAAFPDPHVCLGLELKDLSLGHLFLLHRLESPFVGKAESVTYEDLALAVFICSRSYEEAKDGLRADNLPQFMAHWARLLTRSHGFLFHVGLRKPVKIDIAEKAKAFAEYIAEGMRCPDYCAAEEDGKAADIEALQSIRVCLLCKTNLTDSEIMNRPFAFTLWDFFTVGAMEGRVNLQDAEEMDELIKNGEAIIRTMKEKGMING